MPDTPSFAFAQNGSGNRAVWIYALAAFLIGAALLVRFSWYPVVTSDYTYFVKVWIADLASHRALTAFVEPFADYAPLYLYLLKLIGFIPVPMLYAAKTLSVLGDAVSAWAVYRMLSVSRWQARKDIRLLAAATCFALPTVMMNSALWGQSDALYAAAVMLSLSSILLDAPVAASVWFGVAFAFKVQAIFFAPVLLGYLARSRKTLRYVWVAPAVFVATILPAWFSGGNLWYWLFIYAKQAGEYPYLSVSAQSIFAFVQSYGLSPGATAALFWAGILCAAGIACVIVYLVRYRFGSTPVLLVLVSLASVLFIPYALPRMHERYFYLADLLSTIYAFYEPGRFIVPILVVFASLVSYMPFLSAQVGFLSTFHIDLRVPAALLFIPEAYIVYDLWRVYRRKSAQSV